MTRFVAVASLLLRLDDGPRSVQGGTRSQVGGACPVTQHLQTALRSVEKRGSVKARRAIPESFLKRRDRVALTGPVIVRGDPETGAGLAGSWVCSPAVRCY